MDIPSSSQMADYKFMIPLSHSTPLAEASSSRLSIDTEAAEGKPRPKKKKKASVVPTPHHGIHQRQRTNINNSAPELIPETASSLLHPHKTFIPDKSSAEHQPKAHLVVPSTSAAMISSTKSTSCNSSPKSAFQWPSIISGKSYLIFVKDVGTCQFDFRNPGK